MDNNWRKIVFLVSICLVIISCHSKTSYRESVEPFVAPKNLELMGFTIQAGAFTKVENASRLTEILKDRGLDATYFVAADGLFKVRFGNFATREMARQRAQKLRDACVIAEFYIVQPEDYSVARRKHLGTNYLRESLVKTARDFIGVPYLWGGISSDTGFDCSGLTMTIYQLNGMNMPRHSGRQFEVGNHVDKDHLQKGDLIFFATRSGGKVSHVGIYIGDGRFIHAPSRGKNIRVDSLSGNFFVKSFIGGRTYL